MKDNVVVNLVGTGDRVLEDRVSNRGWGRFWGS